MSVAASSAAIASIAAIQASQAKEYSCKGLIASFDSRSPAVEEMKAYAKCVDFLYPNTLAPEVVIALKALFVIAIVGAVIGVIKEYRSCYTDWVSIAGAGVMGFCAGPVVTVAGFFLFVGVRWLFA